jgi:hypothetical protein
LEGESVGLNEEYAPFRRHMRRFDLLPSLVDVWRYSLHIMERQALPDDYAVGKTDLTLKPLTELVYPWDLEIIARELVLRATRMGTRSLRKWGDLAETVNHIRRLEGSAYTTSDGGPRDVWLEMHRTVQRQFPWQTDWGARPMIRALKVFGEVTVDAIVMKEFGMTMRQILLLALAVSGSLQTNCEMSINQNCEFLDMSRDSSAALFRRITCSIEELKNETAKLQTYDHNWLYSWNPLKAKPLISVNPTFPDRVLCPIPRYLTNRLSDGIFYDLVNSKNFDNPYGNSFEAYVGQVLNEIFPSPNFTIVPEHSYRVDKHQKQGVDWILSDRTGHIFIECKTKRLTSNAATLLDPTALDRDLTVMAQAIAQNYRNILDARDCRTSWKPDGLPVFPLIMTMHDWLMVSPRIDEMLKIRVRHLLAEAEVSEQVLEEMPYTIASANEFEIAGQIMAQVGISSVMTKKTMPERRRWSLLPFVSTEFKQQMEHINWRLFQNDWDNLMPTTRDD